MRPRRPCPPCCHGRHRSSPAPSPLALRLRSADVLLLPRVLCNKEIRSSELQKGVLCCNQATRTGSKKQGGQDFLGDQTHHGCAASRPRQRTRIGWCPRHLMSSPSGQAQTPRNLQPRNNKLKTQNRRKQFSADRKQESGTGSKKQGGRDVLGDAPWRRGVWDSPAQLFPPTPSGRWPCAWPETAAEGSSGSATKKPQVQNSTGFSATKKLEPEARNKKGRIFLESCGRTLEAQAQRPGRARGAAVPSIGPRRPGVRRPVILVPGHLLLPLAVFHPALSDAASH